MCIRLLLIFTLVVLTGCSTVKVEMGGVPAPDHIKQVRVLGLDLIVDTTSTYFYQEKEGDEYLDTFTYLGQDGKVVNIEEADLQTIKFICRIRNPQKRHYMIWLFHTAETNSGEIITSSAKLLYDGDLSLKNLSEELPKDLLLEHSVWMVIRDADGTVRYRDALPIRYRVRGSIWVHSGPSTASRHGSGD